MAAGSAQIVRALEFAAIRAFLERVRRQRIVRTTHTALRGRGFSLGDGHFGTLCRVNATGARSARTRPAATDGPEGPRTDHGQTPREASRHRAFEDRQVGVEGQSESE